MRWRADGDASGGADLYAGYNCLTSCRVLPFLLGPSDDSPSYPRLSTPPLFPRKNVYPAQHEASPQER